MYIYYVPYGLQNSWTYLYASRQPVDDTVKFCSDGIKRFLFSFLASSYKYIICATFAKPWRAILYFMLNVYFNQFENVFG